MANEIWAALIQAVPVAGAVWVGWRGLNTWQEQLRVGRQVDHAEKAFAAAGQMFSAIRAARSPLSQISQEDLADRTKQTAAHCRVIAERLQNASAAWQRFQKHYAFTRLFVDPRKLQLDVANEVLGCIYDLQGHAEMMSEYADNRAAPELIEARKAFYGSSPNPTEKRLREAEKALQAELQPILLPPKAKGPLAATLARLRSAWRGDDAADLGAGKTKRRE